MYVTWELLFLFCMFIIALLTFVFDNFKDNK